MLSCRSFPLGAYYTIFSPSRTIARARRPVGYSPSHGSRADLSGDSMRCPGPAAASAEATDRLYRSEFYEKLADERLKLWHYNPVMLGEMFVEAERTGVIPYPEEA